MRNVRVASLSVSAAGALSERLERIGPWLERAGRAKPDFIVLPEYALSDLRSPEPIPGPLVSAMAECARRWRAHVLTPLVHRTEEGRLYNSVVWLDRAGQVRGVYRKMFPTDYEMRSGLYPGEATPVFETDVGKVGVAICFDLNFAEVAQGLAAGGAEIVFFVSAYEGGRQLARWALDWGFYVVSAHRGGNGHIIDKTGRPLQASSPANPLMVRTLNLDRYIFHLDYNRRSLDAIVERYGAGVEVDICTAEGIFALESRMETTTVPEIARAFGLETYQEYLARSRAARRQRLAGREVVAGPPGGPADP